MSVQSFAPILEHVNLTAGAAATTLGGGDNFRVYGIVAASAAAGATSITFTTADGATDLLTFNIAANATVIMNVPFIADQGLAVSCITTNSHITLLRGHAGT